MHQCALMLQPVSPRHNIKFSWPALTDLMKKECADMALKCPECGAVAHARTSAYEAPSVKRSWYQCQNLECSCTFTALESVDTIIMKPRCNEQESDKAKIPEKQQQTLNRYGSASKLSNRQQIPV